MPGNVKYFPLIILVLPFACGCEECNWTLVCVAVAFLVAAPMIAVLAIMEELRLLAALRNARH